MISHDYRHPATRAGNRPRGTTLSSSAGHPSIRHARPRVLRHEGRSRLENGAESAAGCFLSLVSVAFWAQLLLPLSACASHAPTVRPQPEPAQTASATESEARKPAPIIRQTSPDRYLSHIRVLAHDDLGGRAVGTDGIDLAAGYIAGQFAAAGLQPGGTDGSYFQEFKISQPPKLLDTTTLQVEAAPGAPAVVQPKLREDFLPFGFSTTGSFSGDVTFVGYGITNPEQQYDDYGGVDVAGRVVLMLRREPRGWDPSGGHTDHARFDRKIKLAAEHKAVAALLVNQDPGEDGVDGLMRFRPGDEQYGIPALHVKRRVVDVLLAAGGLPGITELQRRIDEGKQSVSAPLAGVRVNGAVAYESGDAPSRNVIGILPGTGPHANEYVVIGAHYDHVGTRHGKVYNGADDNASGTAGVIEAAWTLAQVPSRDRSVIFMAFTGEETGLDGSRHFVSDPTVDSASIVAMLNLDMIGRVNHEDEANKLAIQGLGTGSVFKEIVDRHAQELGIPYLPDDGAAGGSDHGPFYHANIPSIFFFTGIHADYHQPTDDTERINAAGAAQIVDLANRILLDVANGESAPVFAKVDKPASIFRGAGPWNTGVVMGIMPDEEEESNLPGWRVAQVFPGGGAEKAGMKGGDRITQIDGQPINGFGDYRAVTGDKKPGDVIEVTVLRGQQELTFKVELSARSHD